MFDLLTNVMSAPLPVPMDINIDPNTNGLPGINQLRTIVGAVMTIGLILDDSLKLLPNAADLYEHADDANRRLCNQALFRAIYIDEDNDVRVGYRNPYDGLSLSGLHADALSWAAEAKKMGQARTATKGGPLVASSHLTRLG